MTREMSEYPFASSNLGRNGSREKLVPIYGAWLGIDCFISGFTKKLYFPILAENNPLQEIAISTVK